MSGPGHPRSRTGPARAPSPPSTRAQMRLDVRWPLWSPAARPARCPWRPWTPRPAGGSAGTRRARDHGQRVQNAAPGGLPVARPGPRPAARGRRDRSARRDDREQRQRRGRPGVRRARRPHGVASALRRLGLSGTILGAADQWGLSTTTATDQLVALTNLVAAQSPLSTASRAYALGLMSDVESDQRWGVAAAADRGPTSPTRTAGWTSTTDHGRWVASSVGVLQVGGHQVLLAVLTQHDADLTDGIDLAQARPRAVAAVLREAP